MLLLKTGLCSRGNKSCINDEMASKGNRPKTQAPLKDWDLIRTHNACPTPHSITKPTRLQCENNGLHLLMEKKKNQRSKIKDVIGFIACFMNRATSHLLNKCNGALKRSCIKQVFICRNWVGEERNNNTTKKERILSSRVPFPQGQGRGSYLTSADRKFQTD